MRTTRIFSRIVLRATRLAVVADVLGSLGGLLILGLGGWLAVRGEIQIGILVVFEA